MAPSTPPQRLVGGVDDGVEVERRDVAFDDLDPVRHRAIARLNGPAIKRRRLAVIVASGRRAPAPQLKSHRRRTD